MNGRQEGKLVTYICPTCGTSLKFDGDKKKTVCPSCKNEVEKQFVVNLNFAGSADDEAFKNFYTYDNSLFKFNFEDRKDVLTNTKRREFVEIPSHRLSANDMIALDCLIQELLFKMDKPNKIKETGELYRYANEILSIDDNNVYGVFLLNFLSGQPLTDVLSRRDSLDKANFFVQYLMTNNKVLSRNFDEDIDQIVSYVLNSNLETAEEKFEVLSSIFFEHLEKKHYFNEYAESVFIIASCDCSLQLRQNFIKRLMDICLLNDYQSFIKYIRVCLSVNLDIDCLFAKNKIKCYIYGLNANSISNVIEFLWSFDSVSLFKKKDYTISILDQFLFSAPINLSAQECAKLIDVLKNKPFKPKQFKKYFEQIVLLSMVEKVDIDKLTKHENQKIKKQIRKNRLSKPTEKNSSKHLWSFWKDYWWTKPYKICCLIAFITIFVSLCVLNFDKVKLIFGEDTTEGMSTLGLAGLLSFILFIPAGALLNTIIAPFKWLVLYFNTKIEYGQDIRVKRMADKKNALIMKAEKQNKDLKTSEEFENARLIAYLVETNIDEKLKKSLIDLIRISYIYEPYDEVLNLIDLVNQSNYCDKDNLVKFLILNCVNIKTYKEALTTLEFLKRLNITPAKKDEYTKYLLYNKAKKSLTSITGYLYLFSYLENEVDKFKYMFSVICTYNKDLFYELNNVDIAYASGDISDDLYLLVCKSAIRFALSSVTKDHINELESKVKLKIHEAGISDFSATNRIANGKIIKWVSKKPLTEKGYESDNFLITHIIK